MAVAVPPAMTVNDSGSNNKNGPRMLKDNESPQEITAWAVSVKNFMRRDPAFYPFVSVRTKWDMTAENYGLVDEHEDSKLKWKKEEMAEDLVSFLEIMAGYIPEDHLRAKILADSTCFNDVIDFIRDYFGAEITPESELDFMKLNRKPQEPYRKFFERLASHSRAHLMGKNITVGSIKTGDGGDAMTLSHLNLITQIWLWKINPKLLDIVKKEYGTQLQGKKSLYELMPGIAKNMDSLLKQDGSVQKVTFKESEAAGQIRRILEDTNDVAGESMAETEREELEEQAVSRVRKVFSRRRNTGDSSIFRRNRGGDSFRRQRNGSTGRPSGSGFRSDRSDTRDHGNSEHCARCEHAKKVYNLNLDTRHYPNKCPNQKSIVRLVQADAATSDESEGDAVIKRNSSSFSSSQTKTERRVPPLPREYQDSSLLLFNSTTLPKHRKPEIIIADLSPTEWQSYDTLIRRTVAQVLSSKLPRKEKSPTIRGRTKDISFIITIDEGAEMNIISAKIIREAGIPITATHHGANAADGGGLKVIGQTVTNLTVCAQFDGTEVELCLGRAIVVEGLEADVLLGEPGKRDNDLWTRASEKRVYVGKGDQQYSTSYFELKHAKKGYGVARSVKSQVIPPGQSINIDIPDNLLDNEEVLVSPRVRDEDWFEAKVRKVVRGRVNIVNTSGREISLRRKRAFGEIRATVCTEMPAVRRVIMEDDDGFAKKKFGKKRPPGVSYLSETKVDPDGIMTNEEREKFKELLREYDDIIDPAPGKYNGAYGESNTLINFVGTPPPIEKVYTPSYSREMMKTLADKMDKLIEWGVLVRADDIGISVEHVSSSLLVPKTDGDGYRMVNDLSRLNNFIGKLPATSPSMQDVKNAIARKRFVCNLDLSNYFYQGGMRRCDAQYLGVVHPFNGLYVYVCEPQGLRNASEHAYDRLGMIFGDMVREDRMTRHADGLHVLGDTLEELYVNLAEVLYRVKRSGMTLKPSKFEVAPVNSIIFGWRLEDGMWRPTSHTTSALATCERPTTVKKMRSFLGAFKQFTDLVPCYAPLLHPLEVAQAGRGTTERIEWTEELKKAFAKAQKATEDLEAVTVPRPTDKLHTYSDFSQEKRAVGGKMLIEREVDGVTKWLLAGHFSATIDKAKTKWLPCEGEGAGIKMVLSHFSPWIIENKSFTTHHTDNQPCVQAWKRLQKGAYSNSSRISSFLSEISMLPVTIEYRPGKDMHTSDFASRHPTQCSTPEVCQICKFSREIEVMGDKAALIRSVTVEDIKSGRTVLPLTQRKTWVDVQAKDSTLEKFKHLVKIGQSPNKHKTKGEHTVIKKLYRLFVSGELMIDDKDGAVLVKAKEGAFSGYALVVPHTIYPGLVHTLHIRLDHPSKSQLMALIQRYFYCHGFQAIIEQVTDNCLQCASVKKLPKVLLEDSTETNESCGLQFAADVMEQHSQKVLIVREKLTQYMWAALVDDQKADTLETALLSMILPVVPSGGAVVRTDGGTAFQSLAARTDTELAKHSIKIEVGRFHNVNKNPQAENGVKEFEKEMLRYDPSLKFLKQVDICIILKSINTRIRFRGLSSQEMLFKREMLRNDEIKVEDKKLSEDQQRNREKQSDYQRKFQSKAKKNTPDQTFKVGQFVFIRNDESKTSPRELYVVSDLTKVKDKEFIVIRKAQNQLRSRTYLLRPQELIRAPITDTYVPPEVEEGEADVPVTAPRTAEIQEEAETERDGQLPALTEILSQPEAVVEKQRLDTERPRRRSAERARDLFTKVLNIRTEKEKYETRKYNPCLAETDEGYCYPVVDNRWNHLGMNRAADDIDGLLTDSFESLGDYSLQLLDLTMVNNRLDRRLTDDEIADLEETVDNTPAPLDQDYGNGEALHGLSGASHSGESSQLRLYPANSVPPHVVTADCSLADRLDVPDVAEEETEEDEYLDPVETPTAPLNQDYGSKALHGLSGAPAQVSPQFLRLTSDPGLFHDTPVTDNDADSDEVFQSTDENEKEENEEEEVDQANNIASFTPTSVICSTSQMVEPAQTDGQNQMSTRVLRPTSLSGLPLGKTQDLSTVLREVHRVTPPAPPPVDRTTKKTSPNIRLTRELRPRATSLNYKEVNKGNGYPPWRFQ